MAAEKRKNDRYGIGGMVEFKAGDICYSGNILNTSLGGVLVEVDTNFHQINAGERSSIHIFDIFSNEEYLFDSEVVRRFENGVVFKFITPLTNIQMFLLLDWFEKADNPSYCV